MESASTSSLGLTKVVLYKHGIGYFERRGKVEGPAKINLVCEASEIDDMLKSLLALTGSGKRIDAVTYDSSKTLESRLEEFGFNISHCQGLHDLIGQMKGIPVTLSVSGETVSGRVLGQDFSQQIIDGTIVKDEQLTIYTADSNFRRIPISSISAIKVDDENMAKELKQQLELLFQNAKKKDRKSLEVSLSEPGAHELLIAYSIPCPIWKTSYRLVMHDERVLLQGMAIVDNVQEEDWNEVQIVLVSASPISFIQPLYEPVQPMRQRIAAQGNQSSGPVVAERAQAKRQEMQSTGSLRARTVAQAPVPCAAPAQSAGWGGMDSLEECAYIADEASVAGMFAEGISQALGVDGGEKGELFEYKINRPVSIPRNSSALLPIVQQDIEGERISLYNEVKNKKFPHAAVRFINSTGLTLEGGPVTVMEGDIYAGEALLDTVKPDDKRFLLYAIDQACPVVVRQKSVSRPYYRVRALNGVLYIDYHLRNEKTYQMDNLSEHAKIVYVEHPLAQGWKLVSDTEPSETTQSFYRFRLELEAKKAFDLAVAEESEACEQIWLSEPANLDMGRLDWLCGQNFVDDAFVRYLKGLMELRSEFQRKQEELQEEQRLLKQYTEDQARARENLKTLGASNERYRKIIDSTEDQINEANQKIKSLSRELLQKQQAYREYAFKRLMSDLESSASKKQGG